MGCGTIASAVRRCGVMALGLFLGVSVCAAAEPRAGAWGVEQLMRELAQVKRASGTFVERKELAILTTPLESSGTLTCCCRDGSRSTRSNRSPKA